MVVARQRRGISLSDARPRRLKTYKSQFRIRLEFREFELRNRGLKSL